MKILLLIPDKIANGEECLGGLGNRYRNLLPLLNKKFDVRCVAAGNKENNNWEGVYVYSFTEDFPVEVYSKPHAENLFTLHGTIAYLDFKPDIVIACDHQTFFAAIKLKKLFNFKLILDFNLAIYSYMSNVNTDTLTDLNKRTFRYIRWLEETACENADHIITCSENYTNEIPYNFSCEKSTVPNGIDFNFWNEKVDPIELQGNFKKKIIYIGRFNDQKGVRYVLDDKFILPNNVSLHFIGNENGSNLYPELLNACNTRDNFFYEGFADWNKKKAFYAACDAVLFPSIHEPFGIVGLEAAISKKPLITSRNNGIATYCNTEHCFSCDVKPLDNASIINIEKAINEWNCASEETIKIMTESFYEIIKNFTWEKAAQKFIDVLEKFR